ncbi:Catenin alpha-2, partial [Anabarilius grahami]
LRKAVMDHISDSFLETNVPLLVLIEAAKSGNEKEVKEYAQVFREHANKLVEVLFLEHAEEEALKVLMSVQMILIIWNTQTEGSLDSEVSADPGSLEHADLEDL